jgi:ATP-dependent Clp protease adaptor protein ClpS
MDCKYQLILKNDNKNSYDYVMAVLIKVCHHELLQAEQCAIITHNNGQCDVFSGDLDTILEKENVLKELGLIVEKEKVCV